MANTAPIWITPPGNLGIIPEQEYYELPLDAYDPLAAPYPPLQFSIVAGSLPAGLQIYDDGRILGIPVLGQIRGVPLPVSKVTTSTFTVRIKNIQNQVADRTFTLTVAGLTPPIIIPTNSDLGTYIDGTYVDIQLESIEPNNLLTPIFSIIDGALPEGLTLSSNGRISGYIRPVTSDQTTQGQGYDVSPFDLYGFDFSGINVDRNFQFTVQVADGVNFDTQIYTIYVISRQSLTADNDTTTVDSSYITADDTTLYSPVIYTEAGSLGSIRQNTRFAYQIEAEDYDADAITYEITTGALPTGLTLNATSGWISGLVPFGVLGSITYNFGIRVYKTGNPSYTSETKNFSLKVLGQISDTVTWQTDSELGIIYTGAISDLYISATTPSNRFLQYSLITTGGLPIGLELQKDGTITGRVSFETFGLDGGTVTFDDGLTTWDQKYTFAVSVNDSDNYVYDEKTFTLTVYKRDNQPYENLYCQLLPTRAQRDIFYGIINNSDIIPNSYIYRPWDPWFGVNSLRRVLLQTGLNPKQIAEYVSAMTLNHYWKTLQFGNVKTARAQDADLNTIYEVVYLELIDSVVNDQGLGPNLAISWPLNNSGITTVYPNSFPNMYQRIGDNIGYENRSILPAWMTSTQSDGTVLGFTRAFVICYTQPNKSQEVAYRLSTVIEEFGLINFTIDRYEYDSVLSENFEKNNATGTGTITSNTSSNIVIGTGTAFTSELYPGKTIFVNNITLGTVNTVSNASVLLLTANANSNVSANSFTYDTNVFIINNFVIASGNITANTNSKYIQGIVTNITGTGLITANVDSTTITGIGTAFNTELTVGKQLYYTGNSIGTITSIRSNAILTISAPVSSNLTNIAFTADGTTTLFLTELHLNDTIVVNTNVRLGTVANIHSDTNVELYSNSLSTVSNVSYSHTARDIYTTPTTGDKYLKYPQIGVLP
jgi:hypothetical protein